LSEWEAACGVSTTLSIADHRLEVRRARKDLVGVRFATAKADIRVAHGLQHLDRRAARAAQMDFHVRRV
jgi:hypothetical protein